MLPSMPRSRYMLFVIAAVSAPAIAGAPAVLPPANVAEPSGLEPLDQGFEDTGALNASLRVERSDLRIASGFDRVYRARGNNGHLMRVDGALHAVFPESEYAPTEEGSRPVVPAGTTWVIGDPAVGCSDPTKPSCDTLLAQRPFLLPGPIGLPTRRAKNSQPPPGSIALVSLSRTEPVGRPVASAADVRLSLAILPETATDLEAVAVTAPKKGNTPLPRGFDMSDEFYRRLRLREIAKRHGPKP